MNVLSVKGVDLSYGASHALRRVSLTANKGEVTCILGRNRVGKTSLLWAILGPHPIRAGYIAWEDGVLNELPPHERAPAPGWPRFRRAATSLPGSPCLRTSKPVLRR